MGVLVVGLLIVVLDNTILNVALKTIQQDLNATQTQLIWAINAYSLVFASLLFTWGVLGDRYGRKKILMIGLSLFGLASLLCAFAQSPEQLIAARALMGIGGASALPVTLAIITVMFPPRERGKAIGIWAAAVGGAVAIGPLLGGFLLEHFWWGSVFLINVPIVVVGVIGISVFVPESRNPNPGRLDPLGLVLTITGMLALVYGIQEAGWTRWETYVWIVAGVGILGLFIYQQWRSDHPSMDLALFRNPSFSVPLAGTSLTFAALQGSLIFLAFYYQVVRGWSPMQSGALTVPFAIGQLLAAPRSAKMVARFGARKVIPFGISLALIGMLLFLTLDQTTPVWALLIIPFIFGFGMGNVVAPSTTRMTLATAQNRSGAGSAVQNTVRQLAATLGVAITSSVVGTLYSSKMTDTVDAFVASGGRVPAQVADALKDSVGSTYGVVDTLVSKGAIGADQAAQIKDVSAQAFLESFRWGIGLASVFLLAALVIFVWKLPADTDSADWSRQH